ncbi:hypothetical protein JDV02_003056 [Purpureocillium takamizusanense]|uniref:Uncharacterized protein n=1 Tax=Purpureocillium takamizusanense TaxID=2060973 RepID=A0A9Q8QCU4_9HYPO|nr:uncharacterized protein JDV02_003056 [Purpureocillium takamizusanense]UNI16634.1 hypothetical protein JDV02_003056 [Purpureocillium takamizusanense]
MPTRVRIIEHMPSSSDAVAPPPMASSYYASSALSDSSLASSSSSSSSSAAASYESTPSTAPTSLYKSSPRSRSTRHEQPRRRDTKQRHHHQQQQQEQERKRYDSRDEELDREPALPPTPTITFFPPSPASASLSSVATYDSLLSDAAEPEPEPEPLSSLSSSPDHDCGHRAAPSSVHLPSPADASIPTVLPPYRTLAPFDPSLRPSDPVTFARLFPSLDRLAIRHDDATADGNMNLRVETVVAPFGGASSSSSPVASAGPVLLGARRRPAATVQLFHLRMHDLARRDFSLRRYCRDSGREVCFSKRAYAPAGSSSIGGGCGGGGIASSASHTLHRALRSVKSPFRRSSSSSSSSSGAANDASTTTSCSPRNSLGFARRPSTGAGAGGSTVTAHTTVSSSCWSRRRGSTSSSASLAGNALLLSGTAAAARPPPPPQVLVPTDTVKLEFSNYARVDVSRRRHSSSIGGGGATKAYEFEWWGHRYAWRRAVDRSLGTVSFHLVRDGGSASSSSAATSTTVAHIVPEVRTPTQVFAEDRAGGWVPPCYMWISDPSVVDAVTDVADVIVATGLIALVDDSIRERWPASIKKKKMPTTPVAPYLLPPSPTTPHFGSGPADADGYDDAARRPGLRGFFSRRSSGQHSHSPLRLGRTVAVY